MTMTDHAFISSQKSTAPAAAVVSQMNFSRGGNLIQRKCAECEEKEKLQRKETSNSASNIAPSVVDDVLNSSGGKPLESSTRAYMESRFNYDFNNVKIHDSGLAAKSADSIDALAYTSGNNVVFNSGQYNTSSDAGKKLLAHELTHVVQQKKDVGSNKKIQRLIRTSLVDCPGHNPFAADRRAVALLSHALDVIDAARAARAATPGAADVVTVSTAMRSAFQLDPANDSNWNDPVPHFGLPLIRRRLEIVRNYIDNVVFTITCRGVGVAYTIPGCAADQCGPNTRAFSCPANPTELVLCPALWGLNLNLQAKTLLHEVMHMTLGVIDDWAAPDATNAHCYDQFVAIVNGFALSADESCH